MQHTDIRLLYGRKLVTSGHYANCQCKSMELVGPQKHQLLPFPLTYTSSLPSLSVSNFGPYTELRGTHPEDKRQSFQQPPTTTDQLNVGGPSKHTAHIGSVSISLMQRLEHCDWCSVNATVHNDFKSIQIILRFYFHKIKTIFLSVEKYKTINKVQACSMIHRTPQCLRTVHEVLSALAF